MKTINFFLLCLLFCITNSKGQTHLDCINALDICSNESQALQLNGTGAIIEGVQPCFTEPFSWTDSLIEKNVHWLKYTFHGDGSFLFTIFPENDKDDIDFAIFKSSDNSCNNLTPVRCMFSGPTINPDGTPNEECLGPTGLKEDSTDEFEMAGCLHGSDNFLAPLDVQDGDKFFLVVTSFSGPTSATLEHFGDTNIYCKGSSTKHLDESEIIVFPNPCSDYLSVKSTYSQTTELKLVSKFGKTFIEKSFSGKVLLDTSSIPSGLYFLQTLNPVTKTCEIVKIIINATY